MIVGASTRRSTRARSGDDLRLANVRRREHGIAVRPATYLGRPLVPVPHDARAPDEPIPLEGNVVDAWLSLEVRIPASKTSGLVRSRTGNEGDREDETPRASDLLHQVELLYLGAKVCDGGEFYQEFDDNYVDSYVVRAGCRPRRAAKQQINGARAFAHTIQPGDLVVMPRKVTDGVAIGASALQK